MASDKQQKNNKIATERLKPHRWKKGQSGNPAGRPKGSTLTERISKFLDTVGEEAKDGETYADRLAKAFVREALKGHFQFAKEIIDRTDGKVPDRIADADGGKIEVILNIPRPPNEFK